MSSVGAALGAAVPISNARVEASRKNGAKSRGPKTPAGKARSAQNALKHGMRALRYVVLPDEDGIEFQALEAALVEELAPVGALQLVLVRRVAMAAWRLAGLHRWPPTGWGPVPQPGGQTGRAVRGAALGGRWRRHGPDPRRQRHPQLRDALALPRRRHGRVLARAQDAEGAPGRGVRPVAVPALVDAPLPTRSAPRRWPIRRGPNEPERRPDAGPVRGLEYVPPEPPGPAAAPCTSPPRPWMPNEPDSVSQPASAMAMPA